MLGDSVLEDSDVNRQLQKALYEKATGYGLCLKACLYVYIGPLIMKFSRHVTICMPV